MNFEVIVVGGGASGLMAAIVCARAGIKTLILEHKDRIGKKILATGNGKCNYTNLFQTQDCYRGGDSELAFRMIQRFNETNTLAFFEELGIYPKYRDGYVYPNSEQAASVLDVLRFELDRLQVSISCNEHVTDIFNKKNSFIVKTKQNNYSCKQVILSTGGCASKDLGSDGSGYELLKKLGHRITPLVPALTALRSNEGYFKALAGVRCMAKIDLFVDGNMIATDSGELQLTNYGISGIPVFQLSRFAGIALLKNKKVLAKIDFLPNLSLQETMELLEKRCSLSGYKTIEEMMVGLLNRKLIQVLIKEAIGSLQLPCSKLKKSQLYALANKIKQLEVSIVESNPFETAQVTAGGLEINEINEETLESKRISGLYVTGELIDVDGICGGYNLQWAWSTGYLAGIACTRVRKDL